MQSFTIIVAALVAVVAAKTDIAGCTSINTVDPYGAASMLYFVPGSCEICELLDCGGGRAPPKTTVPGCPLYVGAASYTPSYLTNCGGAPSSPSTTPSIIATTPAATTAPATGSSSSAPTVVVTSTTTAITTAVTSLITTMSSAAPVVPSISVTNGTTVTIPTAPGPVVVSTRIVPSNGTSSAAGSGSGSQSTSNRIGASSSAAGTILAQGALAVVAVAAGMVFLL